MQPPGADRVLIRYGEIGVKSASVQDRMEQLLQNNVEAKLAAEGIDATFEREHTRQYVHAPTEDLDAVTDAVTEVFGVVSASPTTRVDPTHEAIRDALASAASEHYQDGTFAVRARRAGPRDTHGFSSTDIEQEGGAAVWETAEANGIEPEVDLDDPDLTFFVECRPNDAYVFLEKRPGPGGLPVGCQQPLVAMVSGGIDSPVAAWLAMKRGAPVLPLYIDLGEYGGVDHRMRAIETVSRLQEFAPNYDLTLRIAPGGEGIDRIVAEADHFRMLLLRRFMYRIGAHVAEELGAVGLVTGESIGQKSSQTSANLRATSEVTSYPIHRPLLGLDKTEIMERARRIGTYHDSTIDAGCNRIAPDHPATQASLSAVLDHEPDELERLAKEAADAVELVDDP